MRSVFPPPLETIQGSSYCFSGFKSSVYPDPVDGHLIPSPKKHLLQRLRLGKQGNINLQKNGVVCFEDLNFRFRNVAETLQHLGARLAKSENYAQWRDYLKRDMVNLENFHFLPGMRVNALWEAANNPFRKSAPKNDPYEEEVEKPIQLDLFFVSDQMVESKTPRGELSIAAINSIEQFSRMNGLNWKRMKANFYSHAPVAVQNEARNLVEYCCFCYLARCGTDFHPSIKEAAFRRLIFITMLAWQQPYLEDVQNDHTGSHQDEKPYGSNWIVGEDAFVRIAPAIAGVADKPTAHNLFKALAGENKGLSFRIWDGYLSELARVHEEGLQHRVEEGQTLSLDDDECILCVGANKRRPVLMWNKDNIAWPGRLTLTDRALYFEPNGLLQHQRAMKLNLAEMHAKVERKKVGPFGSPIFDTAILVTSNAQSESWVLEFVDFSGEGRREIWFAFINEIVSVYSFIHEYGPAMDNSFVRQGYGSEHGNKKSLALAVKGITKVQAVQSTLHRAVEYPGKLLQFSYLSNAPCGELVLQTLAVSIWGVYNHKEFNKMTGIDNGLATDDTIGMGSNHVMDVDGSVYLRKWMKSPTWESSRSMSFWKQKTGGKGLILGKELLVGDLTYIDRAVYTCKNQSQMLEQTRATIDGATLKGIPSNIDLFKELMLPFTVLSINIQKLQRWENPPSTVIFLVGSFVMIYKNWFKFVCPALLLMGAVLILTLRSLKYQGRLGDGFGRVTIREQPPSNTLQKMLALKEALSEMEIQIQKVNIVILKLRTLALSGHPQATDKVILALVGSALILVFVPFQYVCTFLLFDQFTRELEFRRDMVLKFERQLQEWWQTIPAAPVVVLPHESKHERDAGRIFAEVDENTTPTKGEWFPES